MFSNSERTTGRLFTQRNIWGKDIQRCPRSLRQVSADKSHWREERLFGDLDFDMTKRRAASTALRSAVNMWKHNKTSKFLERKSEKDFKRAMSSGRKNGKARAD